MTTDQEDQREVLRAQLRSKATKNPADMELYELSQLSGITMDPHIFEVLLDLLRKNVPPEAIVHMLRSMCSTAYHQLQQRNLSQTNSVLAPSSSSLMAPPPPSSTTTSSRLEHHSSSGPGAGNSRSLRDVRQASLSSETLDNASSLSDIRRGRPNPSEHRQSKQSSHRGSGEGGIIREGGSSSRYTGKRESDNTVSSRPDRFVTSRRSTSDLASTMQSTTSKRRSYQH